MSTVAVRDADTTSGEIAPWTGTMRSLAEYAAELTAAKQIADAVCSTGFVPDCFRGKPDLGAAAILAGHEMGFPPNAAFRAFYPAPGGRMEMYARAMQAVALSHGHKVWVAKQTDDEVIVRGHAKGMPPDVIYEVTWDRGRVVKAGLLKEKGNHEKLPQQMMAARGIAEMSRLVAPAELHGMYCPEEREDTITVQATIGEPMRETMPALTGADIIAQAATQPPAPAPAVVEPERVETRPSEAALKRMFALMAKAGLGGKDRRELALAWIGDQLGRQITSRDDLTAAEVKRVCDALEQLPTTDPGTEEPGTADQEPSEAPAAEAAR